jgi:hypothetical protein
MDVAHVAIIRMASLRGARTLKQIPFSEGVRNIAHSFPARVAQYCATLKVRQPFLAMRNGVGGCAQVCHVVVSPRGGAGRRGL